MSIMVMLMIMLNNDDDDDDDNKQLLDEVEHDIMNYQNRGLCYNVSAEAEGWGR